MLANLGPQDTEPEQRTEYLWPCNLDAWHHWGKVQTQWRTAEGHRTGLDYACVCAYLSEQGLASGSTERKDIFAGICAAELASLEVWSQQAMKAQQAQKAQQHQKG